MSPEEPDEGLRERVAMALMSVEHVGKADLRRHPLEWHWLNRFDDADRDEYREMADAVLPLLTAERERLASVTRRWVGDVTAALAERDQARAEVRAIKREAHEQRGRADRLAQVVDALPDALWPLPPEAAGSFAISAPVFTPEQRDYIRHSLPYCHRGGRP